MFMPSCRPSSFSSPVPAPLPLPDPLPLPPPLPALAKVATTFALAAPSAKLPGLARSEVVPVLIRSSVRLLSAKLLSLGVAVTVTLVPLGP